MLTWLWCLLALAGPLERASALNAQVIDLHAAGRYEQALPLADEVIALRREVMGPDDELLREAWQNRVVLHSELVHRARRAGDDAAALHWAQAQLEATRKPPGSDTEQARALAQVSALLHTTGRVQEALEHGQQALDMLPAEPTLWRDRLSILANLATTAQALEDFDRSGALLEQATALLDVMEAPPDDELRLRILRTQVEDLRLSGRLAEAAPLAEQLLTRHREASSPMLATALNNTAALRVELGALLDARALLEESLALLRPEAQASPEALARGLNNLAVLLDSLGDTQTAIELLREAIEHLTPLLGPQHPTVASYQCSLGGLLLAQGRLEEARRAYEDGLQVLQEHEGAEQGATSIHLGSLASVLLALGDAEAADATLTLAQTRARALPPEHPTRLTLKLRRARLHTHAGAHAEAAVLLEEVLAARQDQLGADHPSLVPVIELLATVAEARGELDLARAHLLRALSITDRQLDWLDSLSEREALMLARSLSATTHRALALLDAPADAALAWSVVLRFKGAATRRAVERAAFARSAEDPELGRLRARLSALRRGLLRQSTAAGASADQLAVLRRQKEEVERRVAERLPPPPAAPTPAQRCAELEPGELLLDFLRLPDELLAFVVDADCTVTRLRWSDPARLEQLATRWRSALAADVLLSESRGERLASELLGPLLPHLEGAHRLRIDADGELAVLPWAAVPMPDGRRLVETHTLVWQPEATTAPPARLKRVLTVGDVDFGEPRCEEALHPLAGAREEALEMAASWPIAVHLAGREATVPAVLEAAASADLLHLAVHGFVDGGPCLAPSADPMLRAGLALAGANEGPDGILTAEAIAGTSLPGVSLALLSACETALGQGQPGEGVLGLQRGFAIAGVRSLVMSLWSVPDDATRQLMGQLIKRLRRGEPAETALRQAQLAQLRTSRARAGHDRPNTWAAWVVVAP